MYMIKNKPFRQSLLAIAIATACTTSVVHAQTEKFALEEVLVTASKREATLQDTPISVSVTSQLEIDQSKIIDIADLQVLVPSLRVTTFTRAGSTQYAIRGFGNGGSSAGTEPAVGVFIDGVYRSRSSSSISDLPRVQRIEVLSGPQSTLFGKNASAGVISVVTAPPTQEFEARVEATIGNYNQRILKGFVSGGLTDTLSASFSGGTNQRDGYTDGFEGLSDVNDKDRYNLRGQLLFEPNDTMSFRFIADYSDLDEICCTTGAVFNGPTSAAIEALGGELISDEDAFSYTSVLNADPENKIKDKGISLHADIEFDGFTLTSITAFRNNESGPANGDIDYTSLDIAQGVGHREIDTSSQEFRLTSNTDDRFSWMVGASYFDEDIETDGYTLYGEDLRNYVLAITGPFIPLIEAAAGIQGQAFTAGWEIASEQKQENESYSFFGTFDYQLTDALTATVGINYTNDEKDVSITQTNNPDVFSALDLNTLAGGAFSFLKGLQFRPPHLSIPNVVEDGSTEDSDTTYLARLAWEMDDNFNFYASYATGFKSSSWDLSPGAHPQLKDAAAILAAGIQTPNQQYGNRYSSPEYATVYEVGMKSRFDNVSLNVAIFDQSIEDFQARAFDGVNFISTNAGEYSSQGVEFDILYAPSAEWTFTLAGTYLDPVYDDYKDAPPPIGEPGPIDRSGQRPGGIHNLSTTGTVVYNMTFDNGITGYIRGEYLYERASELSDSFPGLTRQVNTANASAGLTFTNGVSTQLWVRNLNEDEYFTGGFAGVAQSGTVNSFLNQPRTYGLTVTYDM
ncbi:MAG: TonB-dependent receptor [Oceanicoccus sp.]